MLKVAGELRPDLKMLEQLARVTRIFGGDQACFTQHADGPRRHVFEITDWSCNKIECAHEMILSSHIFLEIHLEESRTCGLVTSPGWFDGNANAHKVRNILLC